MRSSSSSSIPSLALFNLYELYFNVALNRKLAAANDVRANDFAELAEADFARTRKSQIDTTRSTAGSGTA